ncbi:ParA family protein [Haloarchaeobius sp. FL176]|uniref:ParA family protein n=1 Tax=Haloarchaeobius sp. FL176 TaxID=2967129 RepID=UPI0021482150|nr:ParA family protein [Haloarchaeobius sp. FL176]
MFEQDRSAAVMGVTGGAGATRLTVELATTLARDGRDVAVFDAAFATQGLSQYLHGRIDADLTRLLTDEEVTPEAAMVDLQVDTSGDVSVCPTYAPFERIARAKSGEAAERFGQELRDATVAYDHVLVDTPPVADNPSIAAVSATDTVACVVPSSKRGVDTLARTRDRLADLGVEPHRVVANGAAAPATGDSTPVESADVAVPESDVRGVTDAPVCIEDATGPFARSIATTAEAVFETQLDVEFPKEGLRTRLSF